MSLYHETADFLTSSSDAGGSLKSRIFGKKDLKSQPAQVYALAIESCKWSEVLKEVVENADILRYERKITPVLSVLLVHDLLLTKRGIALPATHGLKTSIERHKARLGAEFTKARIRRKLSSIEAAKAHVEAGLENGTDNYETAYPRWLRINSLKTSIEDQLETTFTGYERAATVEGVRQRGSKRIFIDVNIPNLVAISPNIDLSKSDAYKTGEIIFQDKASCFPAYLLDPLPEDGDIIDTCSAPGNKTTHLAAILLSHNPEAEEGSQTIHAFEKNKARAETLEKMVNIAGSQTFTKLHPGQDFLKTDPDAATFKNVGALLLDPSCSGSGIIGREEMPELHLPVLKQGGASTNTILPSALEQSKESRKRKRDKVNDQVDVLVDDDGAVTAVDNEKELKTRLSALSKFQLELLLHAFKFPSARKITYSTCSIYAQENEEVVTKALDSEIARKRGWRILSRENQIRGMREWPVRGSSGACERDTTIEESCIRANKDDEHGTMGFFLAAFTREQRIPDDIESQFLRDERGHLVRDLLGFPVRALPEEPGDVFKVTVTEPQTSRTHRVEDHEEWTGFEDEDVDKEEQEALIPAGGNNTPPGKQQTRVHLTNRHSTARVKTRQELGSQKGKKKKRRQ